MKKINILLSIIFVSSCFAGTPICLNGQWQFTYTPSSAEKTFEVPCLDSFDTVYEIPDFWDNQMDAMKNSCWYDTAIFREDIPYLYGTGWVRRVIDIPEDWQGKVISLQINRAVGYLSLWINKEEAGSYRYAFYTPCQFDITDFLSYGTKNELLISVDNTRIAPFGEAWCFFWPNYFASGVTDDVKLIVSSGSGRVSDIYVRAGNTLKDAVIDVELENKTAQLLEESVLEWRVLDSNNEIIAAGRQNTGTIDIKKSVSFTETLDGIVPWSVENPKLYLMEIKWLYKDILLDSAKQRFGLRKLESRGRKLFLNDKPIYLRGQFGAYFYPTQGGVVCSKEYWLDNLRKSKQLGMNYLNFAAQVASVGLLEAADEVGIILQCGDHITVLENSRELYAQVWDPIVRFTRKYPSLCIYGFGGERNYYEGVLEQYKLQYEFIKSLNSSCLVMPQQAIRGIDYAFDSKGKEELTPEPFPHHRQRLQFYTEYCDIFGHYSGGAFSYYHDESPLWHEMDKRFEIYSKPLSAHELFIASSYIDPKNMSKYNKRFQPALYNRTKFLLNQKGLLDRWETYAYNSAMLQGMFAKYNLEKVRKCDNMVAFEFLGMSDKHIFFPKAFAVGLLDEFFDFKAGIGREDLVKCNSDTVVLIDYDGGQSINRAYWSGSEFYADIILSHYGKDDIILGRVDWALSNNHKTYVAGSIAIPEIKTGYAKKIAEIVFDFPEVEQTTKFNLKVDVSGGNTNVYNDWDFWVFKPVSYAKLNATAQDCVIDILKPSYPEICSYEDNKDARLLITTEISTTELSHLKKGKDVLLLGYSRFPVNDKYTNFRPGLGARSHHNVGRIINQHPVFENMLNEGWGNWQFYYVFNGANCILFDSIVESFGVDFEPIVEVISSPDEPRRQASIFEMKVGEGRLFVSTAIYDSDNPACVTLLDSILHYMQSNDFNPNTSCSLSSLHQLAGIEEVFEEIEVSPENSENENIDSDLQKIWHKETVKLDFTKETRFQVNYGDWIVEREISINTEGPHTINIEDSGKHRIIEVNTDFTAPVLKIFSEPAIEQFGGVYSANPDTMFIFKASDNLSGIAIIEYSLDNGRTYKKFRGAFKLSKGDYLIKARAVDNAGNITDKISGQDLTGGITSQLVLTVK